MASDNKKALVPKLRFPEFRGAGSWGVKRLDKLARKITTRNHGNKQTRVLTNSAERGVVDQRDYFDKDIANSNNIDNYFVAEKGDYVYNPRVSTTAPVGPISRNNLGTGIMSPLYTVFRFNTATNDFYSHYFKSSRWHAYLHTASNTGARHDRMSITSSDFMAMPLPHPPVREQQKIADCLSSVDALIAAHTDKLAALKAHKQGLLQQLFPRDGETVPSLRFLEFRNADEWVAGELRDVCSMRAGQYVNAAKIHESPANNLFPCYGGNGIRGYTDTATHNGFYSLIGRQGALCGNVTYATGEFYATEHAVVVTARPQIDAKWLFHLLNVLDLNQHATGQAQPGLSIGNLSVVTMRYPAERDEQQKIADCLSSLDTLITVQADKIETLKQHKKGLLQQLFPAMDEAAV
ncbi:MAG TPA: restriction endonuclease subunit S [Gammaproteobacteria bacterium]|nr:restriction endonuclease subunit S [Gammaproteobacteria bacterium]